MRATTRQKREAASTLKGQMLVAMPTMSDKRFRRSVIYMCAHSADGAMGIIVNQKADQVTFEDLLRQLKVVAKNADMPRHLQREVHVGGPVSVERGFVLHSNDYFSTDASLAVTDGICLTATIDILKAIVDGGGPDRSLLALGYSGWSAGQLEAEIQANGWLHCSADHELVFGTDLDIKYDRALAKLGIDLSHLVSEAGHA